jgi:hypothetical protein
MDVMDRAAVLDLPGWYLTAGCLFHTIWNIRTNRPPTHGINDYDLFYFDDSDLSWTAEDKIIQAAQPLFGDVAPAVEIRNEARVHLWYEHHFGVPCPPYPSTEPPSTPSPRPPAASVCASNPQITGASTPPRPLRRVQPRRSTQSRTRTPPRL